MWDGFFLRGLFESLLWIAVALLIIYVLKNRGHLDGNWGARSSGLRLLEERYARGEISREEFLERKAVLLGERPAPSGPSDGSTSAAAGDTPTGSAVAPTAAAPSPDASQAPVTEPDAREASEAGEPEHRPQP
jgi:hypothetical protein